MDPGAIEGYPREEPTHLAVAGARAGGGAAARPGGLGAAQPVGRGVVPVTTEPYDLVIAPGALESPQLAPLWSLLRSDHFQSAVTDLGGYSAKEMGRRIR
jgi:putative molybdopterin biosynthesis protein